MAQGRSKIWAPGTPTKLYTRILRRRASQSSPYRPSGHLFILGPLSVLLTIWGTSYLVSPSLLGPTLILVWSALIGGFILVVEKTGYARNFEGWDFKLTKERLLRPRPGSWSTHYSILLRDICGKQAITEQARHAEQRIPGSHESQFSRQDLSQKIQQRPPFYLKQRNGICRP